MMQSWGAMPVRNTFAVRADTATALLPFLSVAMTGCSPVDGAGKDSEAGGESVPNLSTVARRQMRRLEAPLVRQTRGARAG